MRDAIERLRHAARVNDDAITVDRADVLAVVAEYDTRRRERDYDSWMWDAVNALRLCYHCQPELENKLAEADEAWNAENPAPPTDAAGEG